MTTDKNKKIPLWRDDRFWRIALQLLAVVAFIAVVSMLGYNLNRSMQQRGIQFGFGFLENAASFDIGESLIEYDSTDPYYRVLLAGLINSLRVMILGFVLTTVVGVAAGIASFSENWLVRQLSRVYVEIVRNSPLLLQLFFWYFAVFFSLPRPQEQIDLFGAVFLSKRGIYVPWPENTIAVWLWLGVLVAGAISSIFLWRWRTKLMVERAQSGRPQLIVLIGMAIAAIPIVIIALGWQKPQLLANGTIEGGTRLTLEFSALLAGLVFYTGAFIAEIVRGGIQSVEKGQWEAAKSVGLKSGLVMRLVVFPQAMRAIVPALNSQYINLAKNSSLGVAIGYADFYSVSNTTFNQSGRPIEIFLILMVIYLTIDTLISLGMNWLNNSVQLKER